MSRWVQVGVSSPQKRLQVVVGQGFFGKMDHPKEAKVRTGSLTWINPTPWEGGHFPLEVITPCRWTYHRRCRRCAFGGGNTVFCGAIWKQHSQVTPQKTSKDISMSNLSKNRIPVVIGIIQFFLWNYSKRRPAVSVYAEKVVVFLFFFPSKKPRFFR